MIEIFGIPYLKKGSGIHIKKKNRGKFTEYCEGEVTDKCILKAKKSGNSKLVKRAVFAQNARKWKHKEGGEINNKNLNKDEKPKKKLVIKRLTNSTGMINKRPIPGLLTNELVAQNTKKKENNEIKLTKVPKGQSGWTAYLNPKNWGVKDYVTDTFSQAFNLAEADGQKEFLWRGNRYAVKRVDPKSFNEQLEWFKNYINNYKLQDVLLDLFDSIKVDKLIGKELDRIFKQLDSLYNNFDWYNGDIEEYDKLSRALMQEYDRISNDKDAYYENFRKQKLDSVLYKLNNLKLDRFILTTKSNFKDGTVGYYNPKVDSLYATEDPGTFVHELAHATGADRLKNLQPTLKAMKQDLKNTGDLEYVLYLSRPNEMGARYILNLFLKHLNLPLNEYFVDKDLKKLNNGL